MRAQRKAQRMKLKDKLAMYRKALRGAKYVIDAQDEQLRQRDPSNLIIAPSADIAKVRT